MRDAPSRSPSQRIRSPEPESVGKVVEEALERPRPDDDQAASSHRTSGGREGSHEHVRGLLVDEAADEANDELVLRKPELASNGAAGRRRRGLDPDGDHDHP